MKIKLISLLILFLPASYAKDLGSFGATFPVAEQSFLTLIHERLAALEGSGELQSLKDKWFKDTTSYADRPTPVTLMRTQKSKSHRYYPEIELKQNIYNAEGQVLYPLGTKVNALEQLPTYRPCWLFFNADDKAQLKWASNVNNNYASCVNPTFILTGGSVTATTKKLKQIIYFDQGGALSKKLVFNSVPTVVTRKDNFLCIEEVAITEDGNAL